MHTFGFNVWKILRYVYICVISELKILFKLLTINRIDLLG